jgi:hypothetical protein
MDSGDGNIAGKLLQCFADDVGVARFHSADPRGRLHCKGSDAGNAVAFVRGDGLDVSRYAGPGGRVKSGNREDHGRLVAGCGQNILGRRGEGSSILHRPGRQLHYLLITENCLGEVGTEQQIGDFMEFTRETTVSL